MIVNEEKIDGTVHYTIRCDSKECVVQTTIPLAEGQNVRESIEKRSWVCAGAHTYCPACNVVQVRD